jgi:hypothetical protein
MGGGTAGKEGAGGAGTGFRKEKSLAINQITGMN